VHDARQRFDQGRYLERHLVRQPEAVGNRYGQVLRAGAVTGDSQRPVVNAQIAVTYQAVVALPTEHVGVGGHRPRELVAGDDGIWLVRKLPVDQVNVGATDPTPVDLEDD